MPWDKIAIKRKGKKKYKVVNPESGEVHSKGSTEENANAQIRLLRAVKHGWRPTGKKK